MHKMYSVKAHFLFLSCRDAKFRAYPRVEWPVTPTLMDPPATASRKVMRCHCSSQSVSQTGWSLRGKWAGTFYPKDPMSHVLYLLASGRMRAQKWF